MSVTPSLLLACPVKDRLIIVDLILVTLKADYDIEKNIGTIRKGNKAKDRAHEKRLKS